MNIQRQSRDSNTTVALDRSLDALLRERLKSFLERKDIPVGNENFLSGLCSGAIKKSADAYKLINSFENLPVDH